MLFRVCFEENEARRDGVGDGDENGEAVSEERVPLDISLTSLENETRHDTEGRETRYLHSSEATSRRGVLAASNSQNPADRII